MRRSSAPSFRLDPSVQPNTKLRSTEAILNLLAVKDKVQNSIPQKIDADNSTNQIKSVKPNPAKSAFYNVVWGKKQTKKHRTFEGDGILEIRENCATLRDMDGTILSRSSNFPSVISEGLIISIGEKVIEIIDIISENNIPSSLNNIKLPKKDLLSNSRIKTTDNDENIMPRPAINSCNNNENNACAKKWFNVVWGKKSTKKHKTFEGDGTLEICNKSVILRDMDGTVLIRNSNMNTTAFKEGFTFSIGSKEVEIIETIAKGDLSASSLSKQDNVMPPQKKLKTSAQSRHFNMSAQIKSIPAGALKEKPFNINYEALVLPEPNEEHQWSHNKTKQALCKVSVDPCLAKVLRLHQRDGVIFLYKCIMGFFGDHLGAVLADEMGLGKTLQCVTLVWTLLKQGPYGTPCIKNVMVVAPSSLCTNWYNEFMRWLGRERISAFLVDSKNKPKDYIKLSHTPVFIISYEMVTRYIEDIKLIKFDLLICDEGHRLKNTSVKVSTMLMQVECKRRIIATGTPIQNDLQEFHSIINFVNPGILGTVTDFRYYYLQPIMTSQQPDCTIADKELGEARAKELHEKTSHFILRRTQEIINQYLPKKQELVIFCKISKFQIDMYKSALEFYESLRNLENNEMIHLQLINCLKKICNHPFLIKYGNWDNMNMGNLKVHLAKMLDGNQMDFHDSGKLRIIRSLLKTIYKNNEKIVLVSYSTQMLDLLADMCKDAKYIYTRLDGSIPSGDRQKIIDQFNSPHSDIFVFLLSAKAGGVGLNITGASRLVLFDTDWNPATDLQAMSRIWRDGQKKSVFIYRLLTTGTIEEKMYQRQMSKTSLSGAVVDIHSDSSNLKLSQEELKDLFALNEEICTTHDILHCTCDCNGTIPTPIIENVQKDEDRLCQLSLNPATSNSLKKCLRMHELLQWEHHKYPVAQEILKMVGLEEALQDILFIFRNQGTY